MSESIEDIVQSFVDHDLSALDAFGELSNPGPTPLPLNNPSTTPGTPSTPELQIRSSSAGFSNSRTPNSMLSSPSSKGSIDSMEHYTNINGSKPQIATRKASTTSIGDSSKVSNKFKMFGRRIVSSSSSTVTSPTAISSADYTSRTSPYNNQNKYQEHPHASSLSRVPTINMRFRTEESTTS